MKFLTGLRPFLFAARIRKKKAVSIKLQGERIKNILIVSTDDNFDSSGWLEHFQSNSDRLIEFLCISKEGDKLNTSEKNRINIGKESFNLDLFPRSSWISQQKSGYDLIIVNNKDGNPMLESVAIGLRASFRVSLYPTKFAHFYNVVFLAHSDSTNELISELKDLLHKTLPL